MKLLLAKPRGFCAGVDYAIGIVQESLDLFKEPIYILKEIVHNKLVVESFSQKGAKSVNSIEEVPKGSILIFSAHGVPPEFYTKAKKQGLYILDATCPLVRKVHLEAIRYAKLGYTILYIGHKGHDEAVGVLAEAPDSMILVDNLDDAAKVKPQQQEKLIYLTQTTLSVNETSEIIKVLKQRFPSLQDPPKEDICYATTNRQLAVRSLAKNCDLVLVLGSQNSSNSLRLKECAEEEGAQAFLIDSYVEFDESWLDGVETIGITAGASAPEQLVKELLQFLKEEYNIESSSEQDIIKENMFFPVPNLKKQKEHQALEN